MSAKPSKQTAEPGSTGLKLSTRAISPSDRHEWLQEVICREYAQVEIVSPVHEDLCQDLSISPWGPLQLSAIQSSAISLQRLSTAPYRQSQDAYFAILLIAGKYRLEQHGREVELQPGDMTIYDATRPHRIDCPGEFGKLILAIPRTLFRERVAGIDSCTAVRIPGSRGIGCVTANFLRTSAAQAERLQSHELSVLSHQAMDLMALAATAVHATDINLSRDKAVALNIIKNVVERHLQDAGLDTQRICKHVGLSPRYINSLFEKEGTSLMRYVRERRLERCRNDLQNPLYSGRSLTDIAFRWGFNDAAHFSRAFKQQFGMPPREFRRLVKRSGSSGY